MRNIFILLFLCLIGGGASAQTPFPNRDSVDANRISASVLLHGDLWWEGGVPGYHPKCTYPPGSGKNVNFVGALWMSAYDNAGQLHVASQTYRQDGNDYWPGPLDDNDTVDYPTSNKWAKIWKVQKAEIQDYLATSTHTTANTPMSILSWPAKGNATAMGKSGMPLTIYEDMAPFIDVNANGIYEPLNGDYPNIYNSDQALWWCFSDNGSTHTQSAGRPLKVQVHAMSYAYKRNTLIDQVVYYDYTIVNKSSEDYHDMRAALWNDVEIGYFLDDYIGFDSTWRMGIAYNGREEDGGSSSFPEVSYGANPPASAVTMVVSPGDAEELQPLGSYMYYNNDGSALGNPRIDTEFNHYMRSRFRLGEHLQYDGEDRQYALPDDATVIGGWNECTLGHAPGERRTILSSGDFNIASGERRRMVLALLVDTTFGGCPSITSFDTLRQLADTAWCNFHATHVGVPNVNATAHVMKVYPNPAGNILHIDAGKGTKQISVYNMMGQRLMNTEQREPECNIDVTPYPPGLYMLQCIVDGQVMRATFTKQ